MKKMAVGGTTTKRIIKKSTGGMYGIPQENLGTSGQYGFAKKGGATKKMQNGGLTNGAKKVQKQGPIKTIKKVVKKITRPLKKAQNGIEMNGYGEDTNMMIDKPGYSSGTKAPVRPKRVGPMSGRTPGMTRPNARQPMTREDILNRGKDNNSPYYGMSEEDMINNKMISKPPYKKGGATKATKFAALAPPYDKATFADKIVGAKKSAGSKKLPKAQLGAIIKGVVKYGMKGSKIGVRAATKIGARAAQKNKALTMQAKRLIDLEKVAPGSKRKLIDKVMLNKVTNSERKQIANLFDRVSKVQRTRVFNKDLKKVGLVSGGVMGALGLAAKYVNDTGKSISDTVKDIYGVDKKKKKK